MYNFLFLVQWDVFFQIIAAPLIVIGSCVLINRFVFKRKLDAQIMGWPLAVVVMSLAMANASPLYGLGDFAFILSFLCGCLGGLGGWMLAQRHASTEISRNEPRWLTVFFGKTVSFVIFGCAFVALLMLRKIVVVFYPELIENSYAAYGLILSGCVFSGLFFGYIIRSFGRK